MQAAQYKKGNKYHIVERLNFEGQPSGCYEIYDTKEEALARVAELNNFCDKIKEANYDKT